MCIGTSGSEKVRSRRCVGCTGGWSNSSTRHIHRVYAHRTPPPYPCPRLIAAVCAIARLHAQECTGGEREEGEGLRSEPARSRRLRGRDQFGHRRNRHLICRSRHGRHQTQRDEKKDGSPPICRRRERCSPQQIVEEGTPPEARDYLEHPCYHNNTRSSWIRRLVRAPSRAGQRRADSPDSCYSIIQVT